MEVIQMEAKKINILLYDIEIPKKTPRCSAQTGIRFNLTHIYLRTRTAASIHAHITPGSTPKRPQWTFAPSATLPFLAALLDTHCAAHFHRSTRRG